MATPVPGCKDCSSKTAHGGRTHAPASDRPARYQVMKDGEPIGSPWKSPVAAATFMKGHPGSTLSDLNKAPTPS